MSRNLTHFLGSINRKLHFLFQARLHFASVLFLSVINQCSMILPSNTRFIQEETRRKEWCYARRGDIDSCTNIHAVCMGWWPYSVPSLCYVLLYPSFWCCLFVCSSIILNECSNASVYLCLFVSFSHIVMCCPSLNFGHVCLFFCSLPVSLSVRPFYTKEMAEVEGNSCFMTREPRLQGTWLHPLCHTLAFHCDLQPRCTIAPFRLRYSRKACLFKPVSQEWDYPSICTPHPPSFV